MAKAVGRLTLVALLLVAARAQLVLDDVVEDPGQEQAPAVLGQRPAGATGITDPTTKLLQWSVDNMDHSDVAARAQATCRMDGAGTTKTKRVNVSTVSSYLGCVSS